MATLDSILGTYRSTQHSTTGVSPAELMIGRRFKMPLDQLRKTQFRRRVHFDKEVDIKSDTSQRKSKMRYDQRHRVRSSLFDAGQQVRVRVPVREKLDPVWTDPVSIEALVGPDTVRLDNGSVRNARDLAPVPELNRESGDSDRDESSTETTEGRAQPADRQPTPPNQPAEQPGADEATRSERSQASRPVPVPQPPVPLRRSQRDRHPPAKFNDYVTEFH